MTIPITDQAEEQQLRDHRDWLFDQLKNYTPEAFNAMTRDITGVVTDAYVTPELRSLWFGGGDDEDDPINLARSLSGNVQRLRNESLDKDAVFELQILLYELYKGFCQPERDMRKEATHGAN